MPRISFEILHLSHFKIRSWSFSSSFRLKFVRFRPVSAPILLGLFLPSVFRENPECDAVRWSLVVLNWFLLVVGSVRCWFFPHFRLFIVAIEFWRGFGKLSGKLSLILFSFHLLTFSDCLDWWWSFSRKVRASGSVMMWLQWRNRRTWMIDVARSLLSGGFRWVILTLATLTIQLHCFR